MFLALENNSSQYLQDTRQPGGLPLGMSASDVLFLSLVRPRTGSRSLFYPTCLLSTCTRAVTTMLYFLLIPVALNI